MTLLLSGEADAGPASAQPRKPQRKRFLRISDALADARAHPAPPVSKQLLDFLYSRSRCRSLARDEWEAEVRIATALNNNLTLGATPNLWKDLGRQTDGPRKARITRRLTSAPTLVLGFHGGFGYARRMLFTRMFPDSVIVGATGKHKATDGAHALFAAREALLGGGLVLIAPDGRFGKESGEIEVLGAQLVVTDGAPFLAHTTGCRVVWLGLLRAEHGFTLEMLRGPRRQEGEAFSAYRDRFYRFYAARLEEAFTGDPANLPLVVNWKLIFGAMLAGKVYRFRRPTR